jgi:hypothetical protein
LRIGVAPGHTEHHTNRGLVMSAGEQLVQEDAGLERVEETGRDQTPPQQVELGARKGVGGGQDGTGTGPRRQPSFPPSWGSRKVTTGYA